MSCHYDCSENRTLAAIPDYSDISGFGVVIGYTATAGITVLIITSYYFIAHDPSLDPFRSKQKSVQSQIIYTPNPVDELILRRARDLWGKIWKDSPALGTAIQPASRNAKLDKALLKCVLTLSDLQILTGLSILISGYAQLHCGLSVYHWQILVYLAWFCSLTHLSCLTFLRNHLYNHPGERLWRLIGMGALVVLLLVALLPTGNYTSNRDPADYAICSFRQLGPINQDRQRNYEYSPYDDNGQLGYASMIVSVLLMGLGFISRIMRLYRSITMGLVVSVRKYLSEHGRKFLRRRYKKAKDPSVPSTPPHGRFQGKMWLLSVNAHLYNLLFYRPLLATYLAVRAVLDLWSSMIVEVWWLVASFAWGVFNLALSLRGWSKNAPDPGNWTFGQITPIILLLAPLISVIELVLESPSDESAAVVTAEAITESEPPSRTETMEIASRINSSPPDGVHEESDHDFYQETWFQTLVIFLLFTLIFITIFVLFLPSQYSPGKKWSKGQQLNYLIPSADFLNWIPIAFVLGAINFVLYSLVLKSCQMKLLYAQICSAVSTFTVCVSSMLFADLIYLPILAFLAALYIAICVRLAFRTPAPSRSSS